MPATLTSRIDLSKTVRKAINPVLNTSLVTALDLYSHVKQAHWTVKGPQFISLHELFDTMAAELASSIDTLAERIAALGGTPTGTSRQVAESTPIPAVPENIQDGLAWVAVLADSYALWAKQVREASDFATEQGDATTADLFTGLSREADQRLWFLEAHLV